MKQYRITLTGLSPLLMHNDNLAFGEKLSSWRLDPANKELSVSGDDRSPAWTWLGYCYHDGQELGIPSDNLMTMFREGGAKVKTGKNAETYKKQTQAGILVDQQQWRLILPTAPDGVQIKPLWSALMGENEFGRHVEYAEANGFELLVKRAKIGAAKHVRVRPMFRSWSAVGSFTVVDEDQSGLSMPVLDRILSQAGALCGLGDWRPSSPKSSGTFGRFSAALQRL